jgi:hypothetical protein
MTLQGVSEESAYILEEDLAIFFTQSLITVLEWAQAKIIPS